MYTDPLHLIVLLKGESRDEAGEHTHIHTMDQVAGFLIVTLMVSLTGLNIYLYCGLPVFLFFFYLPMAIMMLILNCIHAGSHLANYTMT